MKKLIGFIIFIAFAALVYFYYLEGFPFGEKKKASDPLSTEAAPGQPASPEPVKHDKQKVVKPKLTSHSVTLLGSGQELFFSSKAYQDETSQNISPGTYALSSFGPEGWSTDVFHVKDSDFSFSPEISPAPVQKNWYQHQGSPARLGLYSGASAVLSDLAWRHSENDQFHSSPVCDAHFLYAAGKSGKVYCWDRLTGKRVWEKSIAPGLNLPPLLWKGFVIQATPSGKIVPLKKKNGKTLAFFPCESNILGTGVLHNQLVIWTSAGDIFSLQLKETTFKGIRISVNWRLNLMQESADFTDDYLTEGSAPVIGSDSVFFQSNGGRVASISLTGKLLWSRQISPGKTTKGQRLSSSDTRMTIKFADEEKDRFIPCPVLWNKHLYVGLKSTMMCMDASTGDMIWQTDMGSYMTSPISTSYGMVFAGTSNGNFNGLTAKEGFPVYSVRLSQNPIVLAPVINQTRVYTGDDQGHVYQVHTFLGDLRANFSLKEPIASISPAVSPAKLYIVGKKGSSWSMN